MDHPGITLVRDTHGFSETQYVMRDGDKMNMIIHQTIGDDSDSGLMGLFRKELYVGLFVLVAKENGLPPVPPLNDMMGASWNNNASYSGHWGSTGSTLQKGPAPPHKERTDGATFILSRTSELRPECNSEDSNYNSAGSSW